MKHIIIFAALIVLSGCTGYAATKQTVVHVKRQVNDEQLKTAVEITCNDVSVGAVRRLWNGDFTTWANFCATTNIIVPPVDNSE